MQVRHGFTLIEMLVVLAIISVLIAMVYQSILPTTQLNKAHDTNRSNVRLQLTNAISQYMIDTAPLTDVPEGIENAKDICRTHLTGTACTDAPVNGYDASFIIPVYLTAITSDPLETDSSITGYRIYQQSAYILVCNTRNDERCGS